MDLFYAISQRKSCRKYIDLPQRKRAMNFMVQQML